MKAARTMYMHMLDGRPASYTDVHGSPYIFFADSSRKGGVVLVPTLRQLRREQRAAQREALRTQAGIEWANPRLYGYQRVQVPA